MEHGLQAFSGEGLRIQRSAESYILVEQSGNLKAACRAYTIS